jgi:hypothetical protein
VRVRVGADRVRRRHLRSGRHRGDAGVFRHPDGWASSPGQGGHADRVRYP